MTQAKEQGGADFDPSGLNNFVNQLSGPLYRYLFEDDANDELNEEL